MKKEISPTESLFQDESKLIEYKSRDDFSKKDTDIVDNIISDLRGKTSNNLKIFIYGVEDNGRVVEPIDIHKFDSGRVGAIQEQICNRFNGECYLIQVPLNDKKHCIFMLFALELSDKNTLQLEVLEKQVRSASTP